MALHRDGKLTVEIASFTLDQAAEAWALQLGSPGAKIVVRTGQ